MAITHPPLLLPPHPTLSRFHHSIIRSFEFDSSFEFRHSNFLFPLLILCLLLLTSPSRAQVILSSITEFQPRALIPNTTARLQSGQPVKIAYIGGAVTAAENSWRTHTTNWFKQHYPKSKIEEISAGINGTGAVLGACRIDHDILSQKPNLLFIEFATNDMDTPPKDIQRAMEGMVRQTWKADPTTDIVFLYAFHEDMAAPLQQDIIPRSIAAMDPIAEYYTIPSLYLGMEVARLAHDNRLILTADADEEKGLPPDKIIFSRDGVHPLPAGIKLYNEALDRALPKLTPDASKPEPHLLPEALLPDNYQSAHILPISRLKLPDGYKKLPPDHPLAKEFKSSMPEIFATQIPDQPLIFKFKGTMVGLFDILGPDSGQLFISLDGSPEQLLPRFDSYSATPRMACQILAQDLPDEVHTLTIRLAADGPDKAAILAQRNQKMDNPALFQGNTWYVSGLMLVGEPAE